MKFNFFGKKEPLKAPSEESAALAKVLETLPRDVQVVIMAANKLKDSHRLIIAQVAQKTIDARKAGRPATDLDFREFSAEVLHAMFAKGITIDRGSSLEESVESTLVDVVRRINGESGKD